MTSSLRHCVITVCRDGLEGAVRCGMSGADVMGKPDQSPRMGKSGVKI